MLVGSQEGLAHLLMAVADPGEGLLMMDVAYPSYFGAGERERECAHGRTSHGDAHGTRGGHPDGRPGRARRQRSDSNARRWRRAEGRAGGRSGRREALLCCCAL